MLSLCSYNCVEGDTEFVNSTQSARGRTTTDMLSTIYFQPNTSTHYYSSAENRRSLSDTTCDGGVINVEIIAPFSVEGFFYFYEIDENLHDIESAELADRLAVLRGEVAAAELAGLAGTPQVTCPTPWPHDVAAAAWPRAASSRAAASSCAAAAAP